MWKNKAVDKLTTCCVVLFLVLAVVSGDVYIFGAIDWCFLKFSLNWLHGVWFAVLTLSVHGRFTFIHQHKTYKSDALNRSKVCLRCARNWSQSANSNLIRYNISRMLDKPVRCCVLLLSNADLFSTILKGNIIDTGAIVILPHWQWSGPMNAG